MKKLLLATTCLALSSTVSMAADMGMPYTKAPMAAPTAFSWTGCYAGAHVGGGNLTTNGTNALISEGLFNSQNANGSGAVAGGQIGCNYQDGNWVFGLEGEGYWSSIKSNQTVINSEGAFGFGLQNNSDFTIAARAGMTFDRTLIYGKGGWAFGNYTATGFSHFSGGFNSDETAKGTLNGFLVGAGIEHALTRNWTVKAEYDFIGYGAKSLSSSLCATGEGCAPNGSAPISSNKQIVKVGFNYLFGAGH